jgi:hypothetical protein
MVKEWRWTISTQILVTTGCRRVKSRQKRRGCGRGMERVRWISWRWWIPGLGSDNSLGFSDEECNVFPCIFNHWSSPPNRFPFFRNLSYPYLSITRYPNNPDSAESDPITHLIITHTYSYYPPVRPFGVPFPLIQFPANYRVIWRHLQITSVPPLVFNPAATTSSRSVAASSSP